MTLAAVWMWGCGSGDDSKRTDISPSGSAPTSRPGMLHYLALGDSYTIGESVSDSERWPVQLASQLRALGYDVADPEIIAHTGWRTDNLDAAMTRANPSGPYDLVSLLIGVNNQYQSRSAEEYRQQFIPLLDRAIALAGGRPARVIVLSIPDWGATPMGQGNDPKHIASEIDAFNAINRAASEQAGVRYIDITPISREAVKKTDLIADDGLHPSGKMYAEWVALAMPAAKDALASSTNPATNPGK
jgi:lysophospholipase L1-like esterase